MTTTERWRRLLAGALLCAASTLCAAQGPLVDARWLQQQRLQADGGLVVLDASPAAQRRAARIPGSRPAEPWRFLLGEATPAAAQQQFRAWGIGETSRVVVLDQGGSYEAARLFHDLHRHGVAPGRLHLLDGGMAAWRAAGGRVLGPDDPDAAEPAGDVRVTAADARQQVGLAEVLQASAEPARTRLVDALEPAYFAGSARFFDRGGHFPHARNWPLSSLFDPTLKTFRPRAELQSQSALAGIAAGQPVIVYCGGGGAAAVPWFVLTQILGHTDTRLYTGSQKEWLQDPRGLPMWTYADPALWRPLAWARSWSGGMLRRMGQSRATLVDVRSATAFAQAHLPDAINVPADGLRARLGDPAALAAHLAAAGLDPAHEAIVASEGGLNRESALAWLALQRGGQASASLLMEGPDHAAAAGTELARGAAAPGRRIERSTPPASPPADGRPRIVIAMGDTAAATGSGGQPLHLPWRDLVDADGAPRAAAEIRAKLTKAGLPVLASVEVRADDIADAAAGLYLLRLMGYDDSVAATR